MSLSWEHIYSPPQPDRALGLLGIIRWTTSGTTQVRGGWPLPCSHSVGGNLSPDCPCRLPSFPVASKCLVLPVLTQTCAGDPPPVLPGEAVAAFPRGHSLGPCTQIHELVLESWNHRMVWVGRDLKDHLVPTPLPWAGTSSTSPGC